MFLMSARHPSHRQTETCSAGPSSSCVSAGPGEPGTEPLVSELTSEERGSACSWSLERGELKAVDARRFGGGGDEE